MTTRVQRAALTALCVAAFATFAAAQLNPTVTVLGVPTRAVPAGCDQSIAPQAMPRVQIEQIPEPTKQKIAPPPAASLRAQLKDVQAAADRSDRSAFRDALALVKTTVSTYAAGGEKDAARDVIRVYDDLDRIWTYQMETPTGAFFDATSAPAQVMRNYPAYERAIADQTFTDSHGTRFYPTTETREFLVREAAARLKTLGVAVATTAARSPRVLPKTATTAPPAKARITEEKTAKTTTAKTAKTTARTAEPKTAEHIVKRPHHVRAHTAAKEKKPAKKPATETVSGEAATKHLNEALGSMHEKPQKTAAKPAEKNGVAKTTTAQTSTPVKEANSKSAPVSKPPIEKATTPKPIAPLTASASTTQTPTASATPSVPPAAAATSSSSTSTPATTSATQTAATTATTQTTATTPTETSASNATTDTTSTTATDTTTSSAAKPPQSKGIILPIILIVVGIGVLIVLFRASS